jgi:glycosyltransferase A (GT-A) superfamily protein (DUF2064 family)
MSIVVAEGDGAVVCARLDPVRARNRLRHALGRRHAARLARSRIYRATVAHRAGLAAERGYRLLEVDASDDSRPISNASASCL